MSKKIALCISGELRYFNNPLITQGYDKFLNVHNPDVFISTWNHIGKSMNHGYIDPHENKIVYFLKILTKKSLTGLFDRSTIPRCLP